ncbi:hypothetical protein NC651_002629 [Populus alba x Populus x berolinensis]|nr:hypothetical protein NC651_002629 [Populus alba x Populus x berolinensis]
MERSRVPRSFSILSCWLIHFLNKTSRKKKKKKPHFSLHFLKS